MAEQCFFQTQEAELLLSTLFFKYINIDPFCLFLALCEARFVMIWKFPNRNAYLTVGFVLSEAILCDACKIKEFKVLESWNLYS